MEIKLGYETFGTGPRHVLVMHDWFADCSTWEPTKPYLSTEDMTYAFVDLRGYGRSRKISGVYSLEEAAGDVLSLAKNLGWKRFAVIGHSMSSMVMQRLLQLAPEQITGAVAITPVAPTSMQLDDLMLEMSKKLALATDERRLEVLHQFWGERLSSEWIRFKAKRWSETAERNAVAGYVDMYGRTDISKEAKNVKTPMLVVAAERDAVPFRSATLEKNMLSFYSNAKVVSLADSGHYPMQEMPPLFSTVVERFLKEG